MTEIEALRWIQKQPGLRVDVLKGENIRLTDGQTVEVTGFGILDAVMKLQRILKLMRHSMSELKNLTTSGGHTENDHVY